MRREGARPRVFVFFFKAAVQLVLLFVAETWVITPCMGRVLGFFQDQVVRRLTGRLPLGRLERRWEYNLAEEVREEAGFDPIKTYIRKR